MAKPEWGTKRLCPSCGIRFYDMKNSPINCPGCEEIVPIEAPVRSRRAAPAPKPVALKIEVKTEEETEVEAVADVAVDGDVDEDNDDDESLIEDTSDLAEEEEVSEIAEHMETDGKPET